MATLNLVYDTGTVTLTDLNDTLAILWGYPVNVPDPANPGEVIPNPQSKASYNREYLGKFIKQSYRAGKRQVILAAAETTVPDVTIT